MRESKKKRLRSRGWRIGSADEFLGLTPAESAYIEMKMSLGEQLRKRRLAKKLTQVQLANEIGSSQSRVAKMEAGDPSVTLDLLFHALLALGASQRDLARAISASPTSPR